jgi:hypothetical protein
MNELFALHKKIYDVRWNGAEGDIEQLGKEFMSLADREGLGLEKVNEMFTQVFIPASQNYTLQKNLKSTHGGKRKGAGRPSLGTTKKVSLTLPDEIWGMIENRKETWGANQSQTLRMMIEGYFYKE